MRVFASGIVNYEEIAKLLFLQEAFISINFKNPKT